MLRAAGVEQVLCGSPVTVKVRVVVVRVVLVVLVGLPQSSRALSLHPAHTQPYSRPAPSPTGQQQDANRSSTVN